MNRQELNHIKDQETLELLKAKLLIAQQSNDQQAIKLYKKSIKFLTKWLS